MRRQFLVLLLVAMVGFIPRSKALIIVVNNLPCDAMATLFAHDGTYSVPCTLSLGYRFTVPANGGFVQFNNVPAANPDWWLPPNPPNPAVNVTAGLPGSQFDAAIVDYQGFGGLLGNTSGCATTNILTGTAPGACGTYTITWTQIGATIVVSIDP